MASLADGCWPEVMRRNHELALQARDLLCARLGIAKPAPDGMLGSMAAIPLPDGPPYVPALFGDPLQDALFARQIEVPIVPWPSQPKRVLRVSAQLYNTIEEYETLARALQELLPRF
jgi:isopenicillin-N epimerase